MAAKNELEERTIKFALSVIKFVTTFPKSPAADVVGRQLLKSGTSIGANYREANRAESKPDFTHKVGIAEKEAAETDYWLEICHGAGIGCQASAIALSRESRELLAILTTIGRKSKGR